MADNESLSKCQPICAKETAAHVNVQKQGRFEKIRRNDDNLTKSMHLCFKMKLSISEEILVQLVFEG